MEAPSEYASLMEAISSFVSACSPEQSQVASLLDNELAPDYRPIKFSRSTRVPLTDLEVTLHAFIVELKGHEYLARIRDFIQKRTPLMRIIECVIYVCRSAEDSYRENDQFIGETIAEWQKLSLSTEQTSVKELLQTHSQGLVQVQATLSQAQAYLNKLINMLAQIGEMVHIPKQVDGVMLRYTMSYIYALLFHQLRVIEKVEMWMRKIQAQLGKLEEQCAKAE